MKSLWMILLIVGSVHLGRPTEFEVHEKNEPKTKNENIGAVNEKGESRILLEGSIVDSVEDSLEESAPTGNQKIIFPNLFGGVLDKPGTVTVHKTKTVTVEHHNPWTKTETVTLASATKTVTVNTCGTGSSSAAMARFFDPANKDIQPTEVVAPNLATFLYDNVVHIKVYDFDPDNQLL